MHVFKRGKKYYYTLHAYNFCIAIHKSRDRSSIMLHLSIEIFCWNQSTPWKISSFSGVEISKKITNIFQEHHLWTLPKRVFLFHLLLFFTIKTLLFSDPIIIAPFFLQVQKLIFYKIGLL